MRVITYTTTHWQKVSTPRFGPKQLRDWKPQATKFYLLDLYAENCDPVLSEEARRHHHDTSCNQHGLKLYVARLQMAEAAVVQFPTWCFSPPAMLKGFFDRMLMPGVAFDISESRRVRPLLKNIRKIAGIVTYGRPRYMVWYMADPPRKLVTRYIRWLTGGARAEYRALYHLEYGDGARWAAISHSGQRRNGSVLMRLTPLSATATRLKMHVYVIAVRPLLASG